MALKCQLVANSRYRDKAYDVITFSVKKGKRDEYKQAALDRGLSLASLLQKSVEDYIATHKPAKTNTD